MFLQTIFSLQNNNGQYQRQATTRGQVAPILFSSHGIACYSHYRKENQWSKLETVHS